MIEYRDSEIRDGAVIIVNNESLTVSHVVFRRGRGLELFTTRPDGYLGPVVYPHPDEPVLVISMPSMTDDDVTYLRVSTSDYPWS